MPDLRTMLAGLAPAAVAAGGATAETIRATSGFGPSHVLATDTYPTFFAKLREFTGGRWDGQDTPSTILRDRMSAEDRAAVAHAAQYAFASGVIGWTGNAAAGRAAGLANGVQSIEPAPDLRAAADAFQVAHVARAPGILAGRGVTDAETKVARYVAHVGKREGLVKDVTTEEDLAELRWREIFAKVDFAQFAP